ncbi:MAG: hypothetical protein QOG62_309 [Thermoleophilaceae bacterium]|jgi:hypothetical protein|nr:hypothetical protein [Thermoleophilaceae bacterium]
MNKNTIRRAAVLLGASAVALTAVAPANAAYFGAKVDSQTQPSNAFQGQDCSTGPGSCTRVENDAYQYAGHELAPKSGKIKKISLVGGVPGSFKLGLAKVNGSGDTAQVKITRQGPTINYVGSDENALDYNVETFKVKNLKVKKGEQIAATSDSPLSTLRCSSGGDNTLENQPALSVGGPFSTVTSTDGCWMLIGATIK